jgi:2-methylcitrate dehydratase PrpD
MTHDGAVTVFAESLSRVDNVNPKAAAVLLADQILLSGRWGAAPGLNLRRAASSAMRGSADDADDVHWGALVHPGAIIWPVALEVGFAQDSSGPEIARAASVGHEAMVRLAHAIAPPAADGYHLTAVVGGVAAAAVASMLFDGSVSPDALGHALSVAGGSSGALLERSGTRSFHRGHAVITGIAAALAATEGLTATRGDLERGGGMLPPWSVATLSALTTDADALAETSLRPFPTSGWNHPSFEAALEAGRSAIGSIIRIVIAVPESTQRASAAGTRPASEAWHHLGHSVARAVASTRNGQSVDELLTRVEVVNRRAAGAEVTIEAVGGATSVEVLMPLGHPQRPLGVEDLARKWGMATSEVVSLLARIESWLTNAEPRNAPNLNASLDGVAAVASEREQ